MRVKTHTPHLNSFVEINDQVLENFLTALIHWYYGISMMGTEKGEILAFVRRYMDKYLDGANLTPALIAINYRTETIYLIFKFTRDEGDEDLQAISCDQMYILADEMYYGFSLDIDFAAIFGVPLVQMTNVREEINNREGRMCDHHANDSYMHVILSGGYFDGLRCRVSLNRLAQAWIEQREEIAIWEAGPAADQIKRLDEPVMYSVTTLWMDIREILNDHTDWPFVPTQG